MLSSISPARFYPPLSTGCPSKQGTRPPHRCCLPLHQANCPLMLTASVRAAPRVAPLRSIPSTFGRGPCPFENNQAISYGPHVSPARRTLCELAAVVIVAAVAQHMPLWTLRSGSREMSVQAFETCFGSCSYSDAVRAEQCSQVFHLQDFTRHCQQVVQANKALVPLIAAASLCIKRTAR